MRKLKYIIYALSLVYLATSCSDSFLETTPIMQDVQSTYYQDDNQMFNALMASYDGMQRQQVFPLENVITFGEIRSDNAGSGGGSAADGGSTPFIANFTNTTDNAISQGIWERCYKGAYRANLVINAEYTSPETEIYKSEALFMRAWHHFHALRVFGPCPISLETLYPDDMEFTRSPRVEVYKQIEKDLLEAIPVLKESHPENMLGRITKSAAQALLGKTYLYWADWMNDDPAIFDKAKTQFEAVVASNKYELINDYAAIFGPHSENNSESVFEIQHATTHGWTNWGTVGTSEGAMWVNYVGPRNMSSKHPEFYDGWGFMLPTKDLQNYFLTEDSIRKDVALLEYDEVEEAILAANPGHSTEKKDIWDLTAYGPDWQGAAQGKYQAWKDYDYVGARALNNPGNEKIIRYADVLLMLAEANLRGTAKDEAKAKKLINEVRKAHMGAGTDDYLTVDQQLALYGDRFKSVLDVLWYERRVELACEGDRWYDLVRSGRAQSVMEPFIRETYDVAWEATDIYLPISSIELAAADGSLEPFPTE
jgi:hypothetical protein